MNITLFLKKLVFSFVVLTLVVAPACYASSSKPSKSSSKQEYVNVNDYNIFGDGKTDCTASIEALLNSSVIRTFYFPSGTYIIDSKVHIPSNTTIIGDSDATVFLAKKGTPRGAMVFIVHEAEEVYFKNICISGNITVNYENMDSSGGITLLDIWYSERVTIESCSFIDNVNAAVRDIGSNYITVNNCHFSNTDCGFITLGNYDTHDLIITNNSFNGHQSSEPISLYANGTHTNVLIENNTISNKTFGGGILVDGKQPSTDITIRNNTITACAVGMHITNVSSLKIQNNHVSNTTRGSGIKLDDCNNAVLDNNSCSNIQHDGMRINNCQNITITNFTATDCGLESEGCFSIRMIGDQNRNISLSDSKLEYNYTENRVGLCIACDTQLTMNNVEFKNSYIWLTKDTSNLSLNVPSSVNVLDQGQSNQITRY